MAHNIALLACGSIHQRAEHLSVHHAELRVSTQNSLLVDQIVIYGDTMFRTALAGSIISTTETLSINDLPVVGECSCQSKLFASSEIKVVNRNGSVYI